MAREMVRKRGGAPQRGSLGKAPKVWIGMLILLAAYVVLGLSGSTATHYGLREVVYSSGNMDYFLYAAGFPIAFFGEFLMLQRGKRGAAVWVIPALSAVCLAVSEILWAGSGFGGSIAASILWYPGFFLFCGTLLAVFLDLVRRMDWRPRAVLLGALVVILVVIALNWPQNLSMKCNPMPGEEYVWYFKQDDPQILTRACPDTDLIAALNYLKVMPTKKTPDDLLSDCKILRISPQYVLVAKGSGSSYVYAYEGDLADFAGGKPKWKTLETSAIYSSIY